MKIKLCPDNSWKWCTEETAEGDSFMFGLHIVAIRNRSKGKSLVKSVMAGIVGLGAEVRAIPY